MIVMISELWMLIGMTPSICIWLFMISGIWIWLFMISELWMLIGMAPSICIWCHVLYCRKGPSLTGGDRRGVLLLFIVLEKETGFNRRWSKESIAVIYCYYLLFRRKGSGWTGGDRRGVLILFYWSMLEWLFKISGMWIWLLWHPVYGCECLVFLHVWTQL